MRQDLTHITLVVDRSGSMDLIRTDAQGGINQLLKEQKEAEGEATLTLVQFDDRYEVVHNGKDIRKVGTYALQPRGMTAPLDAVGKAIVTTGESLAAMPEDQRPATVLCVIVTDGHENSSQEYTNDQIAEMVRHQTDVYGWHFNFIGADVSAFDAAHQMGIAAGSAAVCPQQGQAYRVFSKQVSRARSCAQQGMPVDMEYTDEERKEMET